MIDRAVIKGMDLILAYLTDGAFLEQMLPKFILEESRLDRCAVDDAIDKSTKFRPPDFRLDRTASRI